MHAYERLPSERQTAIDRHSGLPVTRLTDTIGNSHALYFSQPSWTRDDAYLICASERDHGNQLYAIELASGELLRLTDFEPADDYAHVFCYTALNPLRDELYCWRGRQLWAIDLASGERQALASCPDGYREHGTAVSADGRMLYTSISRDLSAELGPRDGTDLSIELHYHAAKPHSAIWAIDLVSGERRVIWDEAVGITHVLTSPTDADLVIFCHEGPWLQVEQRIWGLRPSVGQPWPIISRDPDWGIGHEFWLADGSGIGYHARYREGTWRHAAGFVAADGSDHWQAELSVPTQHAHGASRDWMLFDGTREAGDFLLVAQRTADGWQDPRCLAAHHSSRHGHNTHVHAHVRSDGRQVVYTSDRRGYSDVYLIDLPEDLQALPPYPGKPFRYYWQ